MRRTAVQLASRLLPNTLASFAYHQLTHPQVKKLRPNELAVLDQADKERIPFEGFDVQTYTWAGGPRTVMLIHGWEGQAGNFADLVPHLLEKGYTVKAFDGPSHGFSSTGTTSLFEFATLTQELLKAWKPTHLISHSFGGVATTYALSQSPEIAIDTYVLLTTPDTFQERIDYVANQVGITNGVKQRLINRLEEETGYRVADLAVSSFVQQVNVSRAVIFHDVNDKVIPIAQSERVSANWDVCNLERVEGTGHFRILRTEAVINRVLDSMRH